MALPSLLPRERRERARDSPILGQVRVLHEVSEDEMILAFVRAEASSPTFRDAALRGLGGDEGPVERGRLDVPADNEARREALSRYRGYGQDALLFPGFPTADVEWFRVALTREDIAGLLYARWESWIELSAGSRLVRDGAANVGKVHPADDPSAGIAATEQAIRDGKPLDELIVVAERLHSQHVLVEGHKRATAYARALSDDAEVEAIAGYSPRITLWQLF